MQPPFTSFQYLPLHPIQNHCDLQGRAPFPYALAELIDNSLRATYRGRTADRKIVISFVLSSASNPISGLVSVWDNGCGMTKRELNEWAVMNLSMEDRGSQPVEQAVQRGDKQGSGVSRFLTGNLSYFGVSSIHWQAALWKEVMSFLHLVVALSLWRSLRLL